MRAVNRLTSCDQMLYLAQGGESAPDEGAKEGGEGDCAPRHRQKANTYNVYYSVEGLLVLCVV